jgi:KipI family sensor histidine kinase inhibitor
MTARTTASAAPALEIERLGEDGLLLRFGRSIDAATNARVHVLAEQLRTSRPHWVLDIVPAYASLAIFIDMRASGEDADLADATVAWIASKAGQAEQHAASPRVIRIPVRYGGADGPDLDSIAAHAGLGPSEVIARHARVEYHVAMLGFAPGFPYLLGLDAAIATPRLSTPRLRVPGGSVGIGGAQTGIYPRQGPGGWRIIGRTDLALFDPTRDPPSLLATGDRVRFVPEEAP